tara:strand:+ start:460 stop:918 length:459 start_codon:yes stop_codon:yes gene_type:complete
MFNNSHGETEMKKTSRLIGSNVGKKTIVHRIHRLAKSIEVWLTTGKLDPDVLHKQFTFSSPFWKQANRQEFLDQFLNPVEYQQTALSKIIKFDPIVHCVSEDKVYFTIALTYHTHNGHQVDEVVLCTLDSGLIIKMVSIYDLNETKMALELE